MISYPFVLNETIVHSSFSSQNIFTQLFPIRFAGKEQAPVKVKIIRLKKI